MTHSERLNDIAIVELDTKGFESLLFKKKKLNSYLSQAGLRGKMIGIEQNLVHHIPILESIIQSDWLIKRNLEIEKEQINKAIPSSSQSKAFPPRI